MPRPLLVSVVRAVLEDCRQRIAATNGKPIYRCRTSSAKSCATGAVTAALGEVINGTGILLHTGLGRAPLSSRALAAIVEAAAGYTALELDLASGERGRRVDAVREQLCA